MTTCRWMIMSLAADRRCMYPTEWCISRRSPPSAETTASCGGREVAGRGSNETTAFCKLELIESGTAWARDAIAGALGLQQHRLPARHRPIPQRNGLSTRSPSTERATPSVSLRPRRPSALPNQRPRHPSILPPPLGLGHTHTNAIRAAGLGVAAVAGPVDALVARVRAGFPGEPPARWPRHHAARRVFDAHGAGAAAHVGAGYARVDLEGVSGAGEWVGSGGTRR